MEQPTAHALDAVRARAGEIWPAEVVERWLLGVEPLLGGARPIDVVALHGAEPVLRVLDRIAVGDVS